MCGKHELAVCGNCQRWKEVGRSKLGTCQYSEGHVGSEKAGCYNFIARMVQKAKKPVKTGEQVKMEV